MALVDTGNSFQSALDSISKLGEYDSFMEYLRRKNQTESHSMELFRFLHIKAFSPQVSPSPVVDLTWRSLLLFPLLYKQACKLLLACKNAHNYEEEIIPHDPFGGDNQYARDKRYANTLEQYALRFPGGPTLKELWPTQHGGSEPGRAVSPVRDTSSSSSAGKPQHEDVSPVPALEPASKRRVTEVVQTDVVENLDVWPISVKLREESGEEILFKVKMGAAMRKIMQRFADRKGVPLDVLRFQCHGVRVCADDTLRGLGIEDGDLIHVYMAPTWIGDC